MATTHGGNYSRNAMRRKIARMQRLEATVQQPVARRVPFYQGQLKAKQERKSN